MKRKLDEIKLKAAIAKVDVLKAEIAKKRDELRSCIEDVQEIVDCMDVADEELAAGLRAFDRAADALSERL